MDPSVEKILKLPNKQKIAIFISVLLLEAAALIWFVYMPKHN
jgi:type IV pilus assembly protein PilO